MEQVILNEAAGLLKKANAGLSPRLCTKAEAEELLRRYAPIERLAAFGRAALAGSIGDAEGLARVMGTSVGRARQTLHTG